MQDMYSQNREGVGATDMAQRPARLAKVQWSTKRSFGKNGS